jgi:beta-phosphoglucomutase-like phosphatase (HAD superfamily)
VYEEFAASSAAKGPYRFHPLLGDGPGATPLAWYCPVPDGGTEPEGGERELVRGPFITQDLHQLGIPAPGRTAIVHLRADGPPTLLDPAYPYGGSPVRARTYYEVDLTTHHAEHRVVLPSSGKGSFDAVVRLSWHVEDAVAFVRAGAGQVAQRLLDHFLEGASRITRRHPLRRSGAAQRQVNATFGSWPVPGLAVSHQVVLAPEGTPLPVPRQPRGGRSVADLLAGAETVLIGFEGPLVRLYSAQAAREAALELMAVVAEHRTDAAPLPRGALQEAFVHPLDVLRAFAHDRLGPLLRERLDEIEVRAVPEAPATHNAVALARALREAGRRVCVVTDVCEPAVRRCLDLLRLPLDGVHGRAENLRLLMPHRDCLLRALRTSGSLPSTGVLIGSTVAELTAAQAAGLRFIGLARTPSVERGLREAGCEITVASLKPLLEAARAL